jgi:hypothetical protein
LVLLDGSEKKREERREKGGRKNKSQEKAVTGHLVNSKFPCKAIDVVKVAGRGSRCRGCGAPHDGGHRHWVSGAGLVDLRSIRTTTTTTILTHREN